MSSNDDTTVNSPAVAPLTVADILPQLKWTGARKQRLAAIKYKDLPAIKYKDLPAIPKDEDPAIQMHQHHPAIASNEMPVDPKPVLTVTQCCDHHATIPDLNPDFGDFVTRPECASSYYSIPFVEETRIPPPPPSPASSPAPAHARISEPRYPFTVCDCFKKTCWFCNPNLILRAFEPANGMDYDIKLAKVRRKLKEQSRPDYNNLQERRAMAWLCLTEEEMRELDEELAANPNWISRRSPWQLALIIFLIFILTFSPGVIWHLVAKV